MYKAIEVNRENLSILGVKFPNLQTLESVANAIGSNMFEGFEPTTELIELYVDWSTGAIPESELLKRLYIFYGK